MRILHIHHGAVVDEYRSRERLLRDRHGHDVHVVCPPDWEEGGSLVRPGADAEVPVHVVNIAGRRHPNLFWYRSTELRAVIRALQPEIVDLHEEPYSLAAGMALRAVRREAPTARICVYTAQNLDRRYPPPFSWIERRVLSVARAAYPCSTEAGERLRARGFQGHVRVMPLGVTVPAPAPRRPGPVRVGFVGRLEPYKGGLIAVQAFLAAASTDARLEVVGAGSQATVLKELAGQAEVGGRIEFTGALSQTETLERIGQLDILLVPSLTTPSWKEQFGRVVAQAMVSGAAVIASDSGSLPEVIGDAGLIVPEGDLDAFTLSLRSLLEDPARRESLGELGRRRATERFSWEAVAAATADMYDQMLDHVRQPQPRPQLQPVR